MRNLLFSDIIAPVHFSFYFSFGELGHHPRAEIAAHIAAVMLLNHLRRRAALLGDRLDILPGRQRQTDERVPRAVEIPLPDPLRSQRRIPVILAPLILIDRSAVSVLEKIIVLGDAKLFCSAQHLDDIRQEFDRPPAGVRLRRALFAQMARFADRDRSVLEIDIANAQRRTFRRPHAGPKESEDERIVKRLVRSEIIKNFVAFFFRECVAPLGLFLWPLNRGKRIAGYEPVDVPSRPHHGPETPIDDISYGFDGKPGLGVFLEARNLVEKVALKIHQRAGCDLRKIDFAHPWENVAAKMLPIGALIALSDQRRPLL